MHLSRGHTNSNIISSLPFTESAWFEKRYTPFLLHSPLISHFQGELPGLWKRKCHSDWPLHEAPTWSGFVRHTWGGLKSFVSCTESNNTLKVTSLKALKKLNRSGVAEKQKMCIYIHNNSLKSQSSSTTTQIISKFMLQWKNLLNGSKCWNLPNLLTAHPSSRRAAQHDSKCR